MRRGGGEGATAVVLGLVALVPLAWIFSRALGITGPGVDQADLGGTETSILLANSIWLALFTALFAVLLGLPLALLLNLRRFPGRKLLGWLYFLPLVIPPHIHTIAWARAIGNQGWITAWLKDSFGITLDMRAPLMGVESAQHWAYPLLSSIYLGPAWVMACAYFPLVALSVSAGIRDLDGDGIEAARIARRKGLLKRIILPQLRGRILSGAAFVFILALATYPVVSLMNTPTLIQKVFIVFSQTSPDGGALLGLPLVLTAAIALFVIGRFEPRGQRVGVRPPAPQPGGGLVMCGVIGILGFGAGLPFVSLLIEAGPLSLEAGKLDNYQSVFRRGGIAEAFGDSLLMGISGAILLVAVAWPLARLARKRESYAFEAIGLSVLALPPVVVAVALVGFWGSIKAETMPLAFPLVMAVSVALFGWLVSGRRSQDLLRWSGVAVGLGVGLVLLRGSEIARYVYEESMTLVLLGFLARFLPFVLRLFRNAYRTLDEDQIDAARLARRGSFARLVRIEFPHLRPVVFGGLVMGWVLAFTELAASIMLMRPGWASVQARIFNMVHYRSIGEVAALCVMVILFAVLPVVLLRTLVPRKWEVL